MTDEDEMNLTRAREVLEAQQAWQITIGRAREMHDFELTFDGWPDIAAWFATVPREAPSPREQEQWLDDQLAMSRRTQSSHDQYEFTPRQLEIALEAHDKAQATKNSITERRDRVKELHALHLDDGEIAARIGVVTETVFRHRKKLGLPPNSHGGNHDVRFTASSTKPRKSA